MDDEPHFVEFVQATVDVSCRSRRTSSDEKTGFIHKVHRNGVTKDSACKLPASESEQALDLSSCVQRMTKDKLDRSIEA